MNRKVAARILERLGYADFDMVENGKEVLTALETKSYDVILMVLPSPPSPSSASSPLLSLLCLLSPPLLSSSSSSYSYNSLQDIQMPVMDGWTATEEIFAKYPVGKRPDIIAMTAYAYEQDQQRCALLGMKGKQEREGGGEREEGRDTRTGGRGEGVEWGVAG